MNESNCPNKRQKMEIEPESSSSSDEIFNPTTQDFTLIAKKLTFVDHTLLIELFFSGTNFEPKKLFVSAPSHFCKSSNMNMLEQFFGVKQDGTVEDAVAERHNYETFKNLKIMKISNRQHLTNHFCAHPVLFVDFKTTAINSYQETIAHCFGQIREAFLSHREFLENKLPEGGYKLNCQLWWNTVSYKQMDMDDLNCSLDTLCMSLFTAHGKKRVLVLIDEADAVITAALANNVPGDELQKIALLMENIFGNITKGKIEEQLQGVLLTGISYISGIGYSGMIKAEVYRFLDDKIKHGNLVSKYYGLHGKQLDELLDSLDKKQMLKSAIATTKETIVKNYNSYYTQKGESIFSIWSVLHYLSSSDTEDTYAGMGYIGSCYKIAFVDSEVGRCILKLLAMESITIEYINKVQITQLAQLRDNGVAGDLHLLNTFFSLLMEVGFLTNVEQKAPSSPGLLNVALPNEKIRNVFRQMLMNYDIVIAQFKETLMKQCSDEIGKLQDSYLLDDSFKIKLKSLHETLKSLFEGFKIYKKELNERELQGLMWYTFTRLGQFKTFAEYIAESGEQVDLWLQSTSVVRTNKKSTIAMKLKVNKEKLMNHSSLYALRQITGKEGESKIDYTTELKKRNLKFLLIGLSMDNNCVPSMCIQTSKSNEQILVSETEQELKNFSEYYKGCYDLFKNSYIRG